MNISGRDSLWTFVEKVGGFGTRAAGVDALRRSLAYSVGNTNADTLPHEVFDRVRERVVARGVTQRCDGLHEGDLAWGQCTLRVLTVACRPPGIRSIA